ncbi:CU044_5270 family protein [Streptomyces sp. NPDC096132]|uniref:CU044_5270 family protein n=1 Tax=Streptomyces sp. NPDC096132 TaxID=3366075 RepID=UPI00381D2233
MSQPLDQDLPPGRHQLLKEHLMTEIRRTEKAPGPRRAWLRPALAAGAVATVAALTLVVLPPGDTRGVRQPGTAVAPEGDVLADARDDQYTYVDWMVSWDSVEIAEDGTSTTSQRPLHRMEEWVAVDGTRKGLIDEQGGEGRRVTQPDRVNAPYSVSYRFLSSLPTDADAMYVWLRKTAAAVQKKSNVDRDTLMWLVAGDMFDSGVLPPKQSAALYRAVLRVPGVVALPRSVDAVGRVGVALGRMRSSNLRDEWVFDRKSSQYLGERSVYLKDDGAHKKGTLAGRTAILKVAVVDKRGERP